MLSVQKLYQVQHIEESAILTASIIGLYGTAMTVGAIQAYRHKLYQKLSDQLSNTSITKTPSILFGAIIGVLPMAGTLFSLSEQSKIHKLKTQIKDKLDSSDIKKLNDFYIKIKNGIKLSKKHKETMVKLELSLQKKFTVDELSIMTKMLN